MEPRNYWIVKHDRESIEDRPGWIWNTVKSENARLPPHYNQIKVGDHFALVSYPYYEDDKPIHQAFGIYRVTKEVKFDPHASPDDEYNHPGAFVIKGRLLDGLTERWVTIPNIASYYQGGWTRKAVMRAKSKSVFQHLAAIHEKYSKNELDPWPLSSEPKSEQEVVGLFCVNLKRLGYQRIEKLQERFPDATVINRAGKQEFIEFEYWATSYSHKTKHEGKPVRCVCWIDDRKDKERRRNVPRVIELRERLLK